MDIYVVRALDDSERLRQAGHVPPDELPKPVVRYLGSDGVWWRQVEMAARFFRRDLAARARAESVLADSTLAIDAEIVPLPTEPTYVDRLVPAWQMACVRVDALVTVVLRQSDNGAPRFDAYTFSRVDGVRVMSAEPLARSADLLDLVTGLRNQDGPLTPPPTGAGSGS